MDSVLCRSVLRTCDPPFRSSYGRERCRLSLGSPAAACLFDYSHVLGGLDWSGLWAEMKVVWASVSGCGRTSRCRWADELSVDELCVAPPVLAETRWVADWQRFAEVVGGTNKAAGTTTC